MNWVFLHKCTNKQTSIGYKDSYLNDTHDFGLVQDV